MAVEAGGASSGSSSWSSSARVNQRGPRRLPRPRAATTARATPGRRSGARLERTAARGRANLVERARTAPAGASTPHPTRVDRALRSSRSSPRRGPDRQLRLRRLRLSRGHRPPELGRGDRPRLGRRRGRRPGSRLGAELPADRRRRDAVRRRRRRRAPVRAAERARGRRAAGRERASGCARSRRDLRGWASTRFSSRASTGERDPPAFLDWAEQRLTSAGASVTPGGAAAAGRRWRSSPRSPRALARSVLASRRAGTPARGGRSRVARARSSVTNVEPRGALVGDRVTARARVLVDADRIDPTTVRLVSPLRALRARRGPGASVHEDIGHAAHVRGHATRSSASRSTACYAMEHVVDGQTVSRADPAPPRDADRARTRDGAVDAGRGQRGRRSTSVRGSTSETIDLVETRPAAFRAAGVSYAVSPDRRSAGAPSALAVAPAPGRRLAGRGCGARQATGPAAADPGAI